MEGLSKGKSSRFMGCKLLLQERGRELGAFQGPPWLSSPDNRATSSVDPIREACLAPQFTSPKLCPLLPAGPKGASQWLPILEDRTGQDIVMLAWDRGVARAWAVPQAWVLQARPIQAGVP